ncbi:GNAT family N-acetyltransferase [Senegalia massiliensis]|uniref:GNAT family N-acetyltransferase n=1 Tax=Senegalia massiliensis TaxID=1720316 RepID=A0A845QWP2_9CLOT|nr:GNAT family N-acetyltransferase [Senegalia massiliensis]
MAVFTYPKYRNQGYGKQVVKGYINWCLDKDILPIYLVDIENIPSIKLAESLGFEIKSTEVIVSLTLYN